ncbi:uncharacterized protein LOC110021607 isoform X2 [Phalaenopsis equestris]|uniref:uncharacterized protein LOC110021607 isoform X1 n=1 Tax=Phalaenopsis equestris TaxID=78828 RepID=UPI0009E2C1E0|nr:uncharacterized protein LOC110021607 isoform X1 [Phalaenopsis equestris]XP_020575827.1 uncharacterized protein LOC110021607 isoform X2 [Phalaenopsis equestris]
MESEGIRTDETIVSNLPVSEQGQRESRDGISTVEGKLGSSLTLEDIQNEKFNSQVEVHGDLYSKENLSTGCNDEGDGSMHQLHVSNGFNVQTEEEEAFSEDKEVDPVFDGTERFEMEATGSLSLSPEQDSDLQASAWPEKAVAFKNFVKDKGSVAVSTVLRRLSGKKDDDYEVHCDVEEDEVAFRGIKEEEDSGTEFKLKDVLMKAGDISTWNPLNYIKIGRDADIQNKVAQAEEVNDGNTVEEQAMKGRIIVYTKLGCQECRGVRLFMRQKKLRYVEINIDIYPNRKLELEKATGSSNVPLVYFNEVLIGGLDELKLLEKSGMLDERINALAKDEPSSAAPLPPLPGEDDVTGSGKIDELATIVRKMKEFIVVKDRFYKMRRFIRCFLASEAVDFLAEDQYLEREDAVELGRKLLSQHFFRHVLDDDIFEDGSHLYRFLEDDPTIMTQCYNVSRDRIDVQPKPIIEISSNLRLLSYGIFEAYVSEGGNNVDYNSIHHSEEFKRYLRVIEELERVDLEILSREEKLAFFINLYNMMVIHAISIYGFPVGPLDRKKFLGDFKYVIGGCSYSLSAIQNGVLRGNQRPPYNLTKPFGPKDKRSKVALPYPEPLVHFALVSGTCSGPALRCYSPNDIDKELVEAARIFLRNGGVVLDAEAKVVSISKILRWYSVDFGKNEVEVLKHAANYLEPKKSEELLELLASTQLKVIYQPYDWGLNF